MELNCELWKERFSQWMRLRNWSEQTVSTYLAGLEQFFAYLATQGVTSLNAVSRDLVEGYRTALYQRRFRGRPIAVTTQAARLGAAKAFLRYLVQENYLLVDVASCVDLPKTPRPLPKVLNEDEVVRLVEAPDLSCMTGLRDRAMLEVFYSSGVRSGELSQLSLDDVDWEHQALWVLGKGRKNRLVPMGEEAVAWLEEYLARGRPRLLRQPQERHLFLSRKGGVLDRSAVHAIVTRWAKSAGLQGVKPHTLRHTCATHMLRRGAGIRHLQTMLGHSSPLTTELYTQVDLADLHKVLRRCHPREKAFGR